MYLRKSNGPRTVTLPDGSVLSLADLPPPDTRWVASRKAVVVHAVLHGLISEEEALSRYGLTKEEFESWCAAVARHGIGALRVTALQKYRGPKDN
ncbi:Protein of unknown function [Paracoccus isoporae]|uniref:DUF1153 domain-containing protein n=1 Tax=Paracoccus isoporae TaxID=591205 RepID=A0A1G6XK93_9RHOB|nr:DUF1153 domain-containing protein [Paracoccus isoporae]SDD78492.1 Protein of unknown function [Paracoccus isoporae]